MIWFTMYTLCFGSGLGFLYKFAQALFGKENLRAKNMILSGILYSICFLTYEAISKLSL